MDFSELYDDPFDLNLLPPVPKENSREPLRSSSKTQRSPVVKKSEVALTQGHFTWLSKASTDLDQELSEMLAATSLRSYRTGFESSTAKDMKVTYLSRSDQRSRSNSPNLEDGILVKIERPFAIHVQEPRNKNHVLIEPVSCPRLSRKRTMLQVDCQAANSKPSKRKGLQVKRLKKLNLGQSLMLLNCQR